MHFTSASVSQPLRAFVNTVKPFVSCLLRNCYPVRSHELYTSARHPLVCFSRGISCDSSGLGSSPPELILTLTGPWLFQFCGLAATYWRSLALWKRNRELRKIGKSFWAQVQSCLILFSPRLAGILIKIMARPSQNKYNSELNFCKELKLERVLQSTLSKVSKVKCVQRLMLLLAALLQLLCREDHTEPQSQSHSTTEFPVPYTEPRHSSFLFPSNPTSWQSSLYTTQCHNIPGFWSLANPSASQFLDFHSQSNPTPW